jgi:hypothetical protein
MAGRTANKMPFPGAASIPAEVAVMIMVAIWVFCCKGTRQAERSTILKKTAISPFDIHSYCALKQEWQFRAPADTIGRHHNRKKLNNKHATREAFPA